MLKIKHPILIVDTIPLGESNFHSQELPNPLQTMELTIVPKLDRKFKKGKGKKMW